MNYWWFWLLALASNLAAAAMNVAVLWALGDNRVPVIVQPLQLFGGAIGTVLGAVQGARFARRWGLIGTLKRTSLLEAAIAVAIGACAWSPTGHLSPSQSVAVVVLTGVAAFAVGAGGPAWVSLVSAWPGAGGTTKQVLRDSTQFQLGRTIGPLIGALILGLTSYALQWSAALNALTYLAIAAFMHHLSLTGHDEGSPTRDAAPAGSIIPWRAVAPVLLIPIVLLAVAWDAGRVYLARVLHAAGMDGSFFSVIVSTMALAAVTAATIGLRFEARTKALAFIGLASCTAGLGLWGLAGNSAPFWLAGAILVGAGSSLAVNATTALAVDAKPDRRPETVATLTITRTSVAAIGGMALAPVYVALTTAFFVPVAAILAIALLPMAVVFRRNTA
ncbi:MAG: hypothetical protein Q4B08_04270 [Propionibacteriaceae bacterium]|nr:hypothetical protein [Propionibacteriaceae bacterium]